MVEEAAASGRRLLFCFLPATVKMVASKKTSELRGLFVL